MLSASTVEGPLASVRDAVPVLLPQSPELKPKPQGDDAEVWLLGAKSGMGRELLSPSLVET